MKKRVYNKVKRFRWLKYLAAFLIAPFILKGLNKELGPFDGNRICTSCHSMKPFAAEYEGSVHHIGRSGVKAGCINCHLNGRLLSFKGAGLLIKDSFYEITRPIKTKEDLDARRPALAKKVRTDLVNTKSKACLGCHVIDAIVPTKDRGKNAHEAMKEKGKTCIECHYNLVHGKVPWEAEKKEGAPAGEEEL